MEFGRVGTIIWFVFAALALLYLILFLVQYVFNEFFGKKKFAFPVTQVENTPSNAFSGEITENVKLGGASKENSVEAGQVAAASKSLIGGRKYQEDTLKIGVTSAGALMAVICDGMGGLQKGAEASALAITQLFHYTKNLKPFDDIQKALKQAAIDSDLDLADCFGAQNEKAGTTAVAAMVFGDDVYWLSVGDSRIYFFRNHEIFPITRDHNYALELQQAVEAGAITQQEAQNANRPDALISYLGMGGLSIADTGKISLLPGDAILLCSDGLSKTLTDQEIAQTLDGFGANINACVDALADSAVLRGGSRQDNTSVIVIKRLNT